MRSKAPGQVPRNLDARDTVNLTMNVLRTQQLWGQGIGSLSHQWYQLIARVIRRLDASLDYRSRVY